MAVLSIPRPAPIRVPPVIGGLALLVAAAMLLPPAYLLLRVSGDLNVFLETISRPETFRIVLRTMALAGAVTAATVVISVPVAWLTARTDMPLRGAWVVLLALPLVFPSYVGAFTLVAALGPRGMLQDVLQPLGVERLPDVYGFKGAWLAITLFSFPYVLLPVRAALRRVDRSMEEAARSLGHGPWGTFFRVTLPQLRPAIAAGALLVALYTLSDFGAVSILRFDSLTRVIFIQYKSAFDRTAASSLALLLIAIAVMLVFLEVSSRGRARYHPNSTREPPPVVRLGRWRWPAFAFCALIALVSLGLPLSVIGYWLVRGLNAGQSVDFVGPALFNSVYASSLGALLTVAAAIPIALLGVRYPGRLSGLVEKMTYAGFALPGITIALALIFFAANYVGFLYQTLAVLLFAYMVRFLPEALGSCRASILQTDPTTEEAARALGRGGLYTFCRVTLPQMLPGISAGGMLVFLTAMKELPATLLLSPIGFNTLATEIWATTSEAMFAQAALASLLLVAVSAVPMMLIVLRERSRG